MARILIVGCGGRGQALSRELVAAGHAVRGTTRDEANFDAIRAAGAEPYLGDPDRIMTLMEALYGTTVVAYLLRTADSEALHDGRLRMLTEKIVDTPVRGFLYENGGGEMIVRAARATWNIPIEILETDPADCAAWTRDAAAAVERLLQS